MSKLVVFYLLKKKINSCFLLPNFRILFILYRLLLIKKTKYKISKPT